MTAAWSGFAVGGSTFGFPIDPPHLSVAVVDRSDMLRAPERTAREWPASNALAIDAQGRVLVRHGESGPSLRVVPATDFAATPPPMAMLLGRVERDGSECDFWALPVDELSAPDDQTSLIGLRELVGVLPDIDANLLVSAVALNNWHRHAPFCPRCGRPNAPGAAGWSRTCPEGHEEFPRTDPAVIVLVHDGADRIVLARQPGWPPGRVSVLAGFVEAGEALEATVLREISEEIGVQVLDLAYLGSQPWPFPRSLMVGFAARAAAGAVLTPRDGEIEEARWVDRAAVRRALEEGEGWHVETGVGAPAPEFLLPGHVSIARRMIEGWARL